MWNITCMSWISRGYFCLCHIHWFVHIYSFHVFCVNVTQSCNFGQSWTIATLIYCCNSGSLRFQTYINFPKLYEWTNNKTINLLFSLVESSFLSIKKKQWSFSVSHFYQIKNQRPYSRCFLDSLWSLLLTHWGRVTHICVSKIIIIGSDNGLSPVRRQAIIWTNDGILLIGPLQTNFNEIWIQINTFSFTKMHLKMSSGKCRPYCLGFNVLIIISKILSSIHMDTHSHIVLLFPSFNYQFPSWIMDPMIYKSLHFIYKCPEFGRSK